MEWSKGAGRGGWGVEGVDRRHGQHRSAPNTWVEMRDRVRVGGGGERGPGAGGRGVREWVHTRFDYTVFCRALQLDRKG